MMATRSKWHFLVPIIAITIGILEIVSGNLVAGVVVILLGLGALVAVLRSRHRSLEHSQKNFPLAGQAILLWFLLFGIAALTFAATADRLRPGPNQNTLTGLGCLVCFAVSLIPLLWLSMGFYRYWKSHR